MKSPKPALEARGVTKQYGSKTVLHDISVSVGKGEWLAVLGESGSGKSTLLKIFGRVIDEDSGRVLFEQKMLPPASSKLIPGHDRIKLIHQEFELFPNQSVEENIAYALRFHAPDFREAKVNELLEMTGLRNIREQKAKLLSGGEKQRTAIARALAEQPEVLLLDEPFAHLDNHNRRVLADAIERMKQQEKMACIFVTHEASEALAWSDRLAILRNGEIVQTGTPHEVYENPVNAYVAELTGDINWIDQQKTAYIRPEKLRRTRNLQKSRWAGKVDHIRFHGNYWEIRCVNAEGSLSFYRHKEDISVGEEVMLTYSKRDLKRI